MNVRMLESQRQEAAGALTSVRAGLLMTEADQVGILEQYVETIERAKETQRKLDVALNSIIELDQERAELQGKLERIACCR